MRSCLNTVVHCCGCCCVCAVTRCHISSSSVTPCFVHCTAFLANLLIALKASDGLYEPNCATFHSTPLSTTFTHMVLCLDCFESWTVWDSGELCVQEGQMRCSHNPGGVPTTSNKKSNTIIHSIQHHHSLLNSCPLTHEGRLSAAHKGRLSQPVKQATGRLSQKSEAIWHQPTVAWLHYTRTIILLQESSNL